MGSVLALKSFKRDFGLPTDKSGFADSKNATVSSNVVSLLTAGCFFGAIGAAWLNERFGRRYSLMGLSVVFLIGAALQTGAHHEIGLIYGGRVIAGLGIGGMSSITPIFVSESAPPAVRGRIAGLFQEFLVIGSTFAYWLGYGVNLHMPSKTKQWRVPVAIQLIPGGFMLLGLFFLKESPRWLMSKGRHEEAVESLCFIRCDTPDSPELQQELAEIRAAVEEELNQTEGITWKECLLPGNRYRFITGFVLMFWQQFSGTNSIGKSFMSQRLEENQLTSSRLLRAANLPSYWGICLQCLPVRNWHLRHCQGHHYGNFPPRRHRLPRPQEISHGWRGMDVIHDVHHRSRTRNPPT